MRKLLFILLFLPILSQGQLLYGDSLQLTGVVGTGIRNIGVNENGVLIEYSNIEGVRDTLSILTDSISAHNLRLITLEGKNYILFSDTLNLIGTKYDIEEARFTTSDEIDPIYSQDSIKIVWFRDLKPVQDSLKTAFDTLGVHNTRLLALEIDTAYWNNKVSQEELADSTWLLRDLIRNAKVEKSDDLKALTGSNDLTYISPEKLVEVIKMLSFQNFGQLEDVYAPTITLTIDSLKVGLTEGEAFIENGTLKSKVSSSGFTGLIDGINSTFVLEGIPIDLDIYLNGVYQILNEDYALTGTSITFVKIPYSTDEITIKYTK